MEASKISLYITNESNHILGKRYNIEYELGNGKRMTASSILENVDGVYFWFIDEYGLVVIRQNRILTMTPAVEQ